MHRIQLTALLLIASPFCTAQTVEQYDSLSDFRARIASSSVVDLEDVEAGTPTPFLSRDVLLDGPMELLDTLVDLGHSFWFLEDASPTQFLIANSFGPDAAVALTLPDTANALAFFYRCFACDLEPFQSRFFYRGYDADGELVLDISVPVDFTFDGRFVGIVTPVSVDHFEVYLEHQDGGAGNWVVDDIEFGTAPVAVAQDTLIETPEPVPSLPRFEIPAMDACHRTPSGRPGREIEAITSCHLP